MNRPSYGSDLLRALVALAIVVSGACARSSRASDDPARDAGPQLFSQACAKCHGEDGAGGLAMAANGPKPIDLRDPAWQAARSDDEIAAAIRGGRGAMPPFADVLSADQIAVLTRRVRGLRR